MSKLKEAATLALEALKFSLTLDEDERCAAINALRAALAKPEPTGERAALIHWLRNIAVPYISNTKAADMLEADAREWVGLTDEERNKLWRDVIKWGDPSHDDVDLMKAIEAKLRSKNT